MAQRGINKVIIIGNLGQDPETRSMKNGDSVTNISIATSELWKDKNTGEQRETTEWHRVVFFRKLAEIAGQYLRKRSKVYIEGRLQTRKWQTDDGQDRYTTQIIADQMQMLDSRKDSASTNNVTQVASQQTRPGLNPQQSIPPSSINNTLENRDFDEDIPF